MKKRMLFGNAGVKPAAMALLAAALVLGACSHNTKENSPKTNFGNSFTLSGIVYTETVDTSAKKAEYKKLKSDKFPLTVEVFYNTAGGPTGTIDKEAKLGLSIGKPVATVLVPLTNSVGGLPSVINPVGYTGLVVTDGVKFAQLTLSVGQDPLEKRKLSSGKQERVMFVYVDLNADIKGTGTTAGGLKYEDLSLKLKRGWNTIHSITTSGGVSVKVGNPGFKWVLGGITALP